MFKTFRYDPQSKEHGLMEHTNGPSRMGSHGAQHSACDRCRSKKLGCSGQKFGCTRCKATSSTCVYSENMETRGSRQRKRTESRSSTSNRIPSPARPLWKDLEATRSATKSSVQRSTSDEAGLIETREAQSVRDDQRKHIDIDPMDHVFESPTRTFEEDSLYLGEVTYDLSAEITKDSFLDQSDVYLNNISNDGDSDFDALFQSEGTSLGDSSTDGKNGNSSSRLDALLTPATSTNSLLPSPSSSSLQHYFGKLPSSHQSSTKEDSSIVIVDRRPATIQGRPVSASCIQATSRKPAYRGSFDSTATTTSDSRQKSRIPCSCLQTVVSLFEDLEAQCQAIKSVTITTESIHAKNNAGVNDNFDISPPQQMLALENVLASYKEILNQSTTVLQCEQCTTKSEHLMLLTFVCEKLVEFAQRIVAWYLRQGQNSQPSRPHQISTEDPCLSFEESLQRQPRLQSQLHSRERQPPLHLEHPHYKSIKNSLGSSTGFSHHQSPLLFLGDYEVDSLHEHLALMRVLILLQLRRTEELLQNVKSTASEALVKRQVRRLQESEYKVLELKDKLKEG